MDRDLRRTSLTQEVEPLYSEKENLYKIDVMFQFPTTAAYDQTVLKYNYVTSINSVSVYDRHNVQICYRSTYSF